MRFDSFKGKKKSISVLKFNLFRQKDLLTSPFSKNGKRFWVCSVSKWMIKWFVFFLFFDC